MRRRRIDRDRRERSDPAIVPGGVTGQYAVQAAVVVPVDEPAQQRLEFANVSGLDRLGDGFVAMCPGVGVTTGPSLGRLRRVPPREVWPHEARDFTPWLLENVDVLSDLLGMELVLDVAEHPVGGFSLDLLGRDETTGRVVIVENQLDVSDHTHLGQILTYAAGTNPATIVWITTGFRPEHRAALDWLNERTDEETRFFGVEIEVVQIDD